MPQQSRTMASLSVQEQGWKHLGGACVTAAGEEGRGLRGKGSIGQFWFLYMQWNP